MTKSESNARELSRQLKNERKEHAKTRAVLQQEIDRIWRLVPSHYISLMGVYPPLAKLLHVLAEAADLQDPSRGAPTEDTMRTQFVHTGDRASSSSTEAGVLTHRSQRAAVTEITKQLRWLTHKLSKLIPGEEWEYELPDRPVCWVKGCRKRGVKQSYVAWTEGCAGCGRFFEKEMVG